MRYRKVAKPTLTAAELCHGDSLVYDRGAAGLWVLELVETGAGIVSTTLREPGVCEPGGMTVYRFRALVRINGRERLLEREVGSQASFHEPWEIDGVRLWLDAVDAIFGFLEETHGQCRPNLTFDVGGEPRYHARFALQESDRRICPEMLHPWCPLPAGGLRIEQCYRGEDCWLGAYDGASAHGGLDLNHPRGTPIWAPFGLDDQFCFNSLAAGHNNNRWRGIRRWDDGAEWIIQVHHMTAVLVPEHTPVARGEQVADGAGVLSGAADHSHFVFKIHDDGETILLDPWILFWQMYRDQAGA